MYESLPVLLVGTINHGEKDIRLDVPFGLRSVSNGLLVPCTHLNSDVPVLQSRGMSGR